MKIFYFLFLGLFLLGCSTSSKKTIFTCNENEVLVKICVNTTKAELENIQTTLKTEKKIEFDFSKTTFSSDGKIDNLDFVVKGPEGYKGHVTADFYMSDEYQGFRRDYSKNSTKAFQCGAL